MTRSVFLSLCLFAAPVLAQAPRITAAGDPSVKSDSIYRLAVNPAKFPEEDAAFLLDDGVVRLDADGRGTRTYRQVIQVLKQSAVERMQERSWSWSPGHQKLRVNWVKVVKPDGTVISAKPSHVQEADVPADDDTPIYSDRRVRRASLSGLAPGTLLDFSYTIEETKPFLPGDFADSWGVSTGLQVGRSRYIVDVPASLKLHLRERNLDFARNERVVGDRRIYTWATHDLPKIVAEPLAADSNNVYMSVALSSPITWSDIGHWYANLARPNSLITPKLASKVDSLVRGARTRDDSIRAIHRWVAQDVRYVAIDLGMSGYQPRKPEVVDRTGFGDCKDKATLFVTALSHIGVTAYPVLLNSDGAARQDMPSITQFDHEIAAIPLASGYQFVDLTASLVPYGELPRSEQGGFALVVHPDGSSDEVKLPKTPIASNRTEIRLAGVLSAEGEFNGTYEESAVGSPQGALRNLFENPLDSAQKHNVAQAIAAKFFQGATGDSLTGTNGKDLSVQPHMRVLIQHGRGATSAGSNMVLHMPLANMAGFATAAKEISDHGKRKFPIDPAKLWGPVSSHVIVSIMLPEGWRAELPKKVVASSEFGSYATEYTQQGRELRITRDVTGAIGVQPPEKVSGLVSWLSAVGTDDAQVIVLTKGAPGA